MVKIKASTNLEQAIRKDEQEGPFAETTIIVITDNIKKKKSIRDLETNLLKMVW